MEFLKRNKVPLLWLLSGFGIGLTLISISQAALPSRSTPLTVGQAAPQKTILREIKGGKISSPEFDADLAELNRLEAKYVESAEQMERLKNRSRPRSVKVALPSHRKPVKKGIRK
jgi:hypothetical protein